MKQITMVIENPTGLHARPAKVFVNIAKNFKADIRVMYGEKKANAKSLISLLTLGVERNNEIRITAQGSDEEEALAVLKAAILTGLGDDMNANVPPQPTPLKDANDQAKDPPLPAGTLDSTVKDFIKALPGAPGIAIGPIFHFKQAAIKVEKTFASESVEKNALQTAIEKAKAQLVNLREKMLEQDAESEAAIFDVHLELLDDVELLDNVLEKINQKQSAAQAWQATIDSRAAIIASVNDPLLAARAADIHDVGYRVLKILVGAESNNGNYPDYPVIIVAEDMSPSDTASLDRDKVLGFCTARGGPTAHTAIIARALGLPAVVSAGDSILDLANDLTVIIDGTAGTLKVSPNKGEIDGATRLQAEHAHRLIQAQNTADEPAITSDGHQVEIAANIGGADDARQAIACGAEAVGLLRTEFLFLERTQPPTEEEQFLVYREIAEAMQSKPVIVRTLDVGGDKPLSYIPMEREANPFLGVRGLRLCLARPDIFREQIRAILRACHYGKLRIMFPMVADLTELVAAKAIVLEVCKEISCDSVDIGIMIEVPSAAIMADVLASHVDFFSIGTNDLTQYTMAMDRMHPQLATKSDGCHPAVLRLIDATVRAAHQAGKWVGVCGELGADPEAVPILIGLGVDELSVTVPAIPTVKAQVRQLCYQDAQALAQRALQCATAAEVRQLIKN